MVEHDIINSLTLRSFDSMADKHESFHFKNFVLANSVAQCRRQLLAFEILTVNVFVVYIEVPIQTTNKILTYHSSNSINLSSINCFIESYSASFSNEIPSEKHWNICMPGKMNIFRICKNLCQHHAWMGHIL